MDKSPLLVQLIADAERLQRAQPELKSGLDAFRANYQAYQRMAQQFHAPVSTVTVAADCLKPV